MVPTASPQPRGQVLQAGLPVPAYEASLVSAVGLNIRSFLTLLSCTNLFLVYSNIGAHK